MGDESGSVLETRKSAVRLYQTPFTSRLWRPFLEIQSSREAFSASRSSSWAAGNASGSSSGARAPPFAAPGNSRSKTPSRCSSTAKRGAMESREAFKRSKTWSGYKMHLTETCDEDLPRVATRVDTTPAHASDVAQTEKVHADLAGGFCPENTRSTRGSWTRTCW
jgi:hypothetical protein